MERENKGAYEGLSSNRKKTSIGGQALLEGILMKGPVDTSIAIRKSNGEISLKVEKTKSTSQKYGILKLPILRGISNLYDALKNGTRALNYSRSFDEDMDGETTIGDYLFSGLLIVLVIGVFFLLPSFIGGLLRPYIKFPLVINLIEGLMRIGFFIAYVLIISRQKDIGRVFMYHGAEHKTINTYEAGEDLTVENVRKHSRLHPRCGTSFMFNLIIIGSIVFSIIQIEDIFLKTLIRLISLPLLIGITYELNKWMGRSDSKLSKYMSRAGMFLQRLATVREPDDSMIEVSIAAMEAVIPEDESLDIW